MTKKEIVDLINALPGPMVTTRARKDTLLELLQDRQTVAIAMETPDMPMAKDIMCECNEKCASDCECSDMAPTDTCMDNSCGKYFGVKVAIAMTLFVVACVYGIAFIE